jgi:hypothetical protein
VGGSVHGALSNPVLSRHDIGVELAERRVIRVVGHGDAQVLQEARPIVVRHTVTVAVRESLLRPAVDVVYARALLAFPGEWVRWSPAEELDHADRLRDDGVAVGAETAL